jgi:hypothetical protein
MDRVLFSEKRLRLKLLQDCIVYFIPWGCSVGFVDTRFLSGVEGWRSADWPSDVPGQPTRSTSSSDPASGALLGGEQPPHDSE